VPQSLFIFKWYQTFHAEKSHLDVTLQVDQ